MAVTVNMVLSGYLFRLRLRRTLAVLGAAVILSTFLLGIHWLADIAAGVALGVLSTRLALWANARLPGGGRQAPASSGPQGI